MNDLGQHKPSIGHEEVYHAARWCQATSLSLTPPHVHGHGSVCPVEGKKPALGFAAQPRGEVTRGVQRESGYTPGMSLLCSLKGGWLVTRLLAPHRIQNSDPDIRECAHSDAMALAFTAFALVVGLRPRLTQSRLP